MMFTETTAAYFENSFLVWALYLRIVGAEGYCCIT
jgi:hypothetical protein